MKELFTRSFIRALIITVICALIIGGAIYAYETLWSGKAVITIEEPGGAGSLEATDVSVSRGTWDGSSKTWTVSIPRGSIESLMVNITNTGGDAVTCHYYVSNANPAPGVTITSDSGSSSGWTTTGYVFGAGNSEWLTFQVRTTADAQPGTLPEIELRVGK
jgi:hypothetical protein